MPPYASLLPGYASLCTVLYVHNGVYMPPWCIIGSTLRKEASRDLRRELCAKRSLGTLDTDHEAHRGLSGIKD